MSKSEEYWNQVYKSLPFKKGKGPSAFIEAMTPRLQKGKTLDIGMGEGQNAAYLSKNGFQVKGLDISGVAIDHAKSLALELGTTFETNKADLDLFLFGLMEYDSIVMSHFKPSVTRYYSEIIRALKQGGTLLIESVMSEEQKEVIGTDEAYKDFYFKTNEPLNQFKGLRILFYNEGLINGQHTIQMLAQKPLDKDMAKYGGLFGVQSGSQRETGPSAQLSLAESLFKKKP